MIDIGLIEFIFAVTIIILVVSSRTTGIKKYFKYIKERCRSRKKEGPYNMISFKEFKGKFIESWERVDGGMTVDVNIRIGDTYIKDYSLNFNYILSSDEIKKVEWAIYNEYKENPHIINILTEMDNK